jgi:hypothetical protein
VLASAVLGVLILQRSHASLGSLPSVHSEAPATAPNVAAEESTQAATSAPSELPTPAPAPAESDDLQMAGSEPALIGAREPGLSARPVLPPGADGEPLPGDAPSQYTRGAGRSRIGLGSNGESSRNAWMTRGEPGQAPGLGQGIEASVEILVKTVPRGASVGALGSDARCEPTPCALVVPKDRAVTLRAEARNTSVQKTFTFSEEAEVELRLSNGRNKASTESASTQTPVKPAQVPHAPSDLKVPSIFR